MVDRKEIIIEYLRRSYFAVDGLWFIKLEEETSFEKALDMDARVWQILPKIQARKVRELLAISGNSMSDLYLALQVKLEAEKYGYELHSLKEGYLEIRINECPWHNLMKLANRQHLSARVAEVICKEEFKVWACEFNQNISFLLSSMHCQDKPACKLVFELV